jgi:hypothetical protein
MARRRISPDDATGARVKGSLAKGEPCDAVIRSCCRGTFRRGRPMPGPISAIRLRPSPSRCPTRRPTGRNRPRVPRTSKSRCRNTSSSGPKARSPCSISDFSGVGDTSQILENSAGNIKNGASGFSDAPISLDGKAGHDIHFSNKDGLVIENRLFFVDKKLYQVMTVQAPGNDPGTAADAQRFLGSFHFLSH